MVVCLTIRYWRHTLPLSALCHWSSYNNLIKRVKACLLRRATWWRRRLLDQAIWKLFRWAGGQQRQGWKQEVSEQLEEGESSVADALMGVGARILRGVAYRWLVRRWSLAWRKWRIYCADVNRSGRVMRGALLHMQRRWRQLAWGQWARVDISLRLSDSQAMHRVQLWDVQTSLQLSCVRSGTRILHRMRLSRLRRLALQAIQHWHRRTTRRRVFLKRLAGVLHGVLKLSWGRWVAMDRMTLLRVLAEGVRRERGAMEADAEFGSRRVGSSIVLRLIARAEKGKKETAWMVWVDNVQHFFWATTTLFRLSSLASSKRVREAWYTWRDMHCFGWQQELRSRLCDRSLSAPMRTRQLLFLQALLTQGVLLLLDWMEKGVLRRALTRWLANQWQYGLSPVDLTLTALELRGLGNAVISVLYVRCSLMMV